MKTPLRIIALITTCIATASVVSAAEESTTPMPRMTEYSWMSIAEWYRRHADDVEAAAKGDARLVFAGDSITQIWEGSPAYQRDFEKFNPVNLGVGGDRTENLLWRLQHGGEGNLDPEVVVLLIGVNNLGQRHDTPEAVFHGVRANLNELKNAFPSAKILLLGVFPFEESPDSPVRGDVKQVNLLIRSFADDRVTVMDVGDIFLEKDGSISKDILGDFLHPTPAGYERLDAAILPTLTSWLE